MDTQKVIELSQKLQSLKMENSDLKGKFQDQKRNMTIGYIALVIALLLFFANVSVSIFLFIGAVIYLIIIGVKKNSLSDRCEESDKQILSVKNELIVAEHS